MYIPTKNNDTVIKWGLILLSIVVILCVLFLIIQFFIVFTVESNDSPQKKVEKSIFLEVDGKPLRKLTFFCPGIEKEEYLTNNIIYSSNQVIIFEDFKTKNRISYTCPYKCQRFVKSDFKSQEEQIFNQIITNMEEEAPTTENIKNKEKTVINNNINIKNN